MIGHLLTTPVCLVIPVLHYDLLLVEIEVVIPTAATYTLPNGGITAH